MIQGNKSAGSSKIPAKAFEAGRRVNFQVPFGKVLKGMLVQISGKATPTYATKPTPNPLGVMDSLINLVSYTDGYGNTIKNVSPQQMRDQSRRLIGAPMPELYKLNSQKVDDGFIQGTLAAPFDFSPTTQPMAVRAAFHVAFENVLSTLYSQTFQVTDGPSQSTISIDCKQLSNLEIAGGTNLTSIVGDLQIEIFLIEAPYAMKDYPYDMFRQSNTVQNITGKLNNARFDISRIGLLQGIRFAMKQGASKKYVSPDVAKDISIKLYADGRSLIQEATLQDLSELDTCKRFQDALISGVGYMNLLNNSQYDTALAASGFSTLYVEVSTPDSMNYSVPAEFEIGIDEIIPNSQQAVKQK